MRWITRRNIHVDRTSCPWLIRRFIDPQAEFEFVDPTAATASLDGTAFAGFDYEVCKGCEICADVCPVEAIAMVEEVA